MLRIVDVDGTYDSKMEPKLPAEVLKTAYRHLVLVRTLDTRMLSLQRQGRIGFYVPSTGEEACQIGSAMALEKRDWVFPAYREPGAAIWRGFPLETLIAQATGTPRIRNTAVRCRTTSDPPASTTSRPRVRSRRRSRRPSARPGRRRSARRTPSA